MRKAYDTILQTEVYAVLAANSGGSERYRYECSCCGEEVYIAAVNSTHMVAHFRHRSGNNDVECENYLGQFGAISTDSRSRRSNRESVEFYFDNQNKTFSIGLRFSVDEIKRYEQQDVNIEIRTQDSEKPFYSLPITGTYFEPDAPTLISLNDFSFSYYLSNNLDVIKREYDFLNPGNKPTFFKVQGNDSDFKAKLVRSTDLYTNIKYFVAFQRKYAKPSLPDGIMVTERCRFETMGQKFLGMVLTINTKTTHIDEIIESWGYRLEMSETLTMLWPPAPIINNDVSVIASDYAYVFTSFKLQAHGNINVHSADIYKVGQNISRISVKQKAKIFKKNAEIVIEKVEQPLDTFNLLTTSKSRVSQFAVPSDGSYFLFNRSGVSPLNTGQVVFMTPQSVIVRYKCNYPMDYIYISRQIELTNEDLLEDILMHYKRKETLNLSQFISLTLSETATRYIDRCKSSGLINSVAKQYISKGLL